MEHPHLSPKAAQYLHTPEAQYAPNGQQQPMQQWNSQPQPNRIEHTRPNQSASKTYSGKICSHWRKSGSCPNKRCPYAATHTAINSPRYAKYMRESTCHLVQEEVVQPRPNALEIKDPSPTTTPPTSRGATPTPERKVREHALEIKEVPTAAQPAPVPQPQPTSTETDRGANANRTEAPTENPTENAPGRPLVEPATGATAGAVRSKSRFSRMFGSTEA